MYPAARSISSALLCTILAGCATPPPLKLDFSTERRLTASDAVEVYISDADKKRLDQHKLAFGHVSPQLVETGPVWARAFVGNLGKDPVFTIRQAELRDSVAGMGFTARFTYVVDGEFSYEHHIYPIHAEGSRAAAAFIFQAMQQSVELGIAYTGKQIKQLIASRKDIQTPYQALEPTIPGVTPRAETKPRVAPPGIVAHLER